MKLIAETRRILKRAGYIPLDCPGSYQINIIHNLVLFCLIAIPIIAISITVVKAENFQDSSDAFGMLGGITAISSSFLVLKLQTGSFISFVGELERTIDNRMKLSTPIKTIYQETDSGVEKLTKTINKSVIILISLESSMQIILSTYLFLFDAENARNSVQLNMPMT